MRSVSRIPGAVIRRIKRVLRGDPDAFLRKCRGVIHVGANSGQERDAYAKRRLPVIWIEPIPEVFAELRKNIGPYRDQRAIEALVTDKDGGTYEFHVSNLEGVSSSILEFDKHKDIWPHVEYQRTISLTSKTLDSLMAEHQVDLTKYDALIMDTQGSELLVLKGGRQTLSHVRYVKTEAADFESYAGCCKIDDLAAFLAQHGFREVRRTKFAERKEGGTYFDVLFSR